MHKLHLMLAAVRERIHGSATVQGFDDAAAVTIGFMAGEWQALMRELEAAMSTPEPTRAPAPPAPTQAPAPPAPTQAPASDAQGTAAPLSQVADALASNPSQAPTSAGPTEAPLV